MPEPTYSDLARKYGLAPMPDSVVRLTQLVARQDADMDEIGRVISKDPGLKAKLLRAANPKAESDAEFAIETVEDALMRTGLGCVLLLAMSAPLSMALVKAFQTMLSLKLESVGHYAVDPLEGTHVLGEIGFSGKAEGRVYVRMSVPTAKKVAGKILGMDVKDLDDATVSDTVGELVNIMTGNFKSNLCDAGLDCRLTPPQVSHTNDLETPTISGGGLEQMTFRCEDLVIFVDVTVNPWND